MQLKLENFKEFIISEYKSGKNCMVISKENNWYSQSVSNLLKKYGFYNSYRPKQGNIRFFKDIDSYIKAYFIGFIAADGCLQSNGKNSYGLTITIHSKDRVILDKLKNSISCENKIYEIKGKMTYNPNRIKNHCRFQLFNKYLFSDLLKYGLTEKKSLSVPNIILTIPNQFKKAFILGYFDGDGCASYNIKNKQLIVSFKGTLELLSGIANELNLSKYSIRSDSNKRIYTLSFWRKQDIKNFYNLYNNSEFFLERKYKKFSSFLEINKDETISSS
jgi:intein/homing endonuclease